MDWDSKQLPVDLVAQIHNALKLMSLQPFLFPSPDTRLLESKHGYHIVITPYEHLSNFEIIYAQAVLTAALRQGDCDWKREAMNYRRFRQGYVNNVLFEP